jgi:hypothetical protein
MNKAAPPGQPTSARNGWKKDLRTGITGGVGAFVLVIGAVVWFTTDTPVNECKNELVSALAAQQCGEVQMWHTISYVVLLAGLALIVWAIVRYRKN